MVSAVDRLIERDAFDYSDDTEELFRLAVAEAFAVHFNGSTEFRLFVTSRGFGDSTLPVDFELERLPWIFVNVFKQRDLVTGPLDDVVLELTSSGTGGRKSRNFLDRRSLERIKRIARKVYDGLGMVDPGLVTNYVCFTYDPKVAGDLGTAFTDELLTSFTATGEVFYAIRYSEERGGFHFDAEGTMSAIERFAASGRPLRLLGFPAFIHRLICMRIERRAAPLSLGELSWAMTGGGWKTHEGESIPRRRFAELLQEHFGIPVRNVRDLFGMVEHGVPYVQCEKGSFHIPIYSMPIVRHPLTLEVLPDGETGLLQLITPYWTSYPALSILTGDLASIEPPCSCGRGGKTLVIAGRGGIRKHKGCAIQAAELLRH